VARVAEQQPEPEQEWTRVLNWHIAQMKQLGISEGTAQMLAMEGATYWDVRRLVAAGCPERLIRKILAPL